MWSVNVVDVHMNEVGEKEFVAMMRGAIQQVRHGENLLSELDSACGDGDHGITMRRAMERVEAILTRSAQNDFRSLVYDVGWALLGVDGGATGPLLGSLFMGMSEALDGKQMLDATGVAEMFEDGLQAVQRQTKAKVGNKTMIDALVPAVAAVREGANRGNDISEMLRHAAESAGQGAAATREMVAQFGKAKFSGERSLGHQDAGATSMALIFRGFSDGFNKLQSV
jgi:phosphoenolpyruvate---glycerone phosphotransferase subunit DhaL